MLHLATCLFQVQVGYKLWCFEWSSFKCKCTWLWWGTWKQGICNLSKWNLHIFFGKFFHLAKNVSTSTAIIRACNLFCKRPRYYLRSNKTRVTERIFKLTPNSCFCDCPDFLDSLDSLNGRSIKGKSHCFEETWLVVIWTWTILQADETSFTTSKSSHKNVHFFVLCVTLSNYLTTHGSHVVAKEAVT